MKNKHNLIFLLLFSFFSINASAELVTFSCDFPNYVNDETKGTQNFKLEFNVDTISGQSFMMGNLGMSEVLNFMGSDGISFIEMLDTGSVQTTTVVLLPDSELGSAVHSRHTMISGLVPSQNYGYCTIN